MRIVGLEESVAWRLLLTEGHLSMQEEGYGEPEPLIDFWEEQTLSLPRL